MKIVAFEIESIHGAANEQRMMFFRATDDSGVVHSVGPVFTTAADFDPVAMQDIIIAKIEAGLTEEASPNG
jgi:hypothetical protein